MVKIELPSGQTAEINELEWTCDDPMLKQMLDTFYPYEGFSPSMGDPDLYIAKSAIEKIGGKIVHHDEVEYDPDMIY